MSNAQHQLAANQAYRMIPEAREQGKKDGKRAAEEEVAEAYKRYVRGSVLEYGVGSHSCCNLGVHGLHQGQAG